MTSPAWHIVTGEYPPALGGVAAYSRSIACELAVAGDEVHVWAPLRPQRTVDDLGVRVHGLTGGYGAWGLREFSRDLGHEKSPKRILLQYVPQAFGAKGMNIPFCARVRRLRASEVWVMFHEVATPWAPWRQWKRNVGSAASRVMVRMLLDRADRVFVSIPMWEPLLRAIAPRWQGAVTWLPVPSSVPTCVSFADVGAVRTRLPIVGGGAVIGHFGSYGPLIAPLVEKTVLDLVERDPRRVVLLVGRGSDAMAATLKRASRPESRILGTGSLDPSQIAVQLAACDVLVQPYHDGVSSRRTSVMAGLALGVPTVTNEGALTEPLWRPSGAVQLARSVNDIVDQTDAVLANRGLAEQIASNGRALYNQMFAIELTIKRLRCARAPETI